MNNRGPGPLNLNSIICSSEHFSSFFSFSKVFCRVKTNEVKVDCDLKLVQ